MCQVITNAYRQTWLSRDFKCLYTQTWLSRVFGTPKSIHDFWLMILILHADLKIINMYKLWFRFRQVNAMRELKKIMHTSSSVRSNRPQIFVESPFRLLVARNAKWKPPRYYQTLMRWKIWNYPYRFIPLCCDTVAELLGHGGIDSCIRLSLLGYRTLLLLHSLYCSSVISMFNCAALDLIAFHPVKRDAKWTYRDIPKSAGLMISYDLPHASLNGKMSSINYTVDANTIGEWNIRSEAPNFEDLSGVERERGRTTRERRRDMLLKRKQKRKRPRRQRRRRRWRRSRRRKERL